MALRNVLVVENENETLRKKTREVTEINDKIKTIIEDMKETMYAKNGVGLAAPQIGILKKIIVIDVGEGPITLINPVIVYKKGEVEDSEGCLSVPGVWGMVKRPETVIVRGLNENGEEIEVTGSGLLARALCHETDHLDGVLFTDKVTEYIDPNNIKQEG